MSYNYFYLFSTNYYFRLKESLITEFDLEITNGKVICIPIGTNKYCYSCWTNEENKFDIELRIKS